MSKQKPQESNETSDYKIIKPSEQGDLPNHPALEGIPDDIKSEEAYNEIQKKIVKIMHSDHKHRKVSAFVNCKRCKDRVEKRNAYLKEKGFKNYGQYLTWRQVMDIVVKVNKHEEKTS